MLQLGCSLSSRAAPLALKYMNLLAAYTGRSQKFWAQTMGLERNSPHRKTDQEDLLAEALHILLTLPLFEKGVLEAE